MKIAVLTSGGVDSSVALMKLKEEGHDVTPFYIKIWMEEDFEVGECPWEEDMGVLQDVTKLAGLKLETVSLQKEYWEKVISYTIAEVKAGRTPNPDIFCNSKIKFGVFQDYFANKFDKIATGHYATKIERDGKEFLGRGNDLVKDQSYFLSQISYEQLTKSIFPIGHIPKKDVRGLARQYKLPNAKRPDSQGLCFLGKVKFRDFLKFYVGEKSGKIIEKETGKILGDHPGFWFYTLGQRHGLDLGGGPWYVVGKSSEENIVYISHQNETREVKEFEFANPNWISEPPNFKKGAMFKIRHGPEFHFGRAEKIGENRFHVKAKTPLKGGVAPGQFAVFYDDKTCFGGGVIS